MGTALATLGGGLAGCSRGSSHGPSGPPIPQTRKDVPVPVTVATVAQKNVPLELQVIGTARAWQLTSASSSWQSIAVPAPSGNALTLTVPALSVTTVELTP